MIKLSKTDIPNAYASIEAGRSINGSGNGSVFDKFTHYWVAFNSIYSKIALLRNHINTFETNSDGSIKTKVVGTNLMPRVKTVSERTQLSLAFAEFDDELKDSLITHFSTKFFINRTPIWQGMPLATDQRGQRLNGVLNVARTVNPRLPVWSPIDADAYTRYMSNPPDATTRDLLSEQILMLTYTVRCNFMHGGKNVKLENDIEVTTHALLLLEMIVNAFTQDD